MTDTKDIPAAELPDWQDHPDAWRCDENAIGHGPCPASEMEAFQDLFFSLVPVLTDQNATAEAVADARQRIERSLSRVAIYTELNNRTHAVWKMRQAKQDALDREKRLLMRDRAHHAFAEEHAASGNTTYYFSHFLDIQERFHVDIMGDILPKPQPYTNEAQAAYQATLKRMMTWDNLREIAPKSPAFGRKALVRRYVERFLRAGDQPRLVEYVINDIKEDPHMTPLLLSKVLEQYKARRDGPPPGDDPARLIEHHLTTDMARS